MARSGQAVATALAERGERVIAVDRGSPELGPLPDSVDVRLGDDGVTALDEVAVVIKSPGVPHTAPVVEALRSRPDVALLGELELAWRLVDVPVVAVTGTNGKTTTVEMLGHVLRGAGLDVAVVGNVGRAYSSLALAGAERPELVVCEASSFQLEDTERFAPEVGVLLNLGVDHLDRHGTVEHYHDAKLALFANQVPEDLAVVPAGLDRERVGGEARVVTFGSDPGADLRIGADALCWRGRSLIGLGDLGVPGPHNAENAAAAALVALERGIDPSVTADGLRSFSGVPHRLERVAEEHGVLWVNDSKATNVAAAVVALRSFGTRPVHVILGGTGKGEDYGPLREPLAAYARHAYLIGEEAGALASAIDDVVAVTRSGTLQQAVTDARAASEPGDVILLAPACASYDQFRDFEHRGQVFTDMARTAI